MAPRGVWKEPEGILIWRTSGCLMCAILHDLGSCIRKQLLSRPISRAANRALEREEWEEWGCPCGRADKSRTGVLSDILRRAKMSISTTYFKYTWTEGQLPFAVLGQNTTSFRAFDRIPVRGNQGIKARSTFRRPLNHNRDEGLLPFILLLFFLSRHSWTDHGWDETFLSNATPWRDVQLIPIVAMEGLGSILANVALLMFEIRNVIDILVAMR